MLSSIIKSKRCLTPVAILIRLECPPACGRIHTRIANFPTLGHLPLHVLTGSSTYLRYTFKIFKMRALTATGKENFTACIAMIVVTAVFIIARFAVRLSQRQTPLGSDWLCLLSLGLFYAYCGLILNCESVSMSILLPLQANSDTLRDQSFFVLPSTALLMPTPRWVSSS